MVIPDKPVNAIQAKIDQYRQQAAKTSELTEEPQRNFFEVVISIQNISYFLYFKHIADMDIGSVFILGHDTKDHHADKGSN